MTKIEPLKIIKKYYHPDSEAYKIMVTHGELVKKKALDTAKKLRALKPDIQFISEAAMLHDIGMILTDAPGIDCHGKFPYIAHGYLGAKLLKKAGLPRHALVSERHTGTGISRQEIIKKKLPLPKRNMIPLTLEEKIICFADKFFSKNPAQLSKEKSITEIEKNLAAFGADKVAQFHKWLNNEWE